MNSGKKHQSEVRATKPDATAPNGTEVEHTPIIVDGASAKIEFSSVEYHGSGVAKHTSAGLFLQNIENLDGKLHDDTQSSVCHEVQPDEVCEVVVHCQLPGQGEENFTISGGGKNAVISGAAASTVIDFNEGEYPKESEGNGRRRHANLNRKIVKLEIFTVAGGHRTLVHDCPLIPSSGRCKYTIRDPHVKPHHH